MFDIYFLSGKISSLEKKFIDYEKLKKLIESKTIEEFLDLLEGTFFKIPKSISHPDEIINYFEEERKKLIEEIDNLFEEYLKIFFLLKYDYFNLACLIENREFFSHYGTVNFYILKEAIEKRDFSKIPSYLINAFEVLKLKKEIEEKLLLLKIDYYKNFYKISENISPLIRDYAKIEIDFANIYTYFNKKISGEAVKIEDLIENGNIKKEFFLEESNLFKNLTSIYKKISLPLSEENIEIEKHKIIVDFIKIGRIKPDSIEKILFFYIAREIEIENVQRLCLSKFYKLDYEILKKISIIPYQYKWKV